AMNCARGIVASGGRSTYSGCGAGVGAGAGAGAADAAGPAGADTPDTRGCAEPVANAAARTTPASIGSSSEPAPASVTPTEPPGSRRSIHVVAPDPDTCSAPARTTASPRTITSTPPSPSSTKANGGVANSPSAARV